MAEVLLVCDDDLGMRETLFDILSDAGFEVRLAQDGRDAVSQVQDHRPNVVLMDIKMPVMNGVEAFKAIKARQPDLPVIMMTAYALDEMITEAISQGATEIVPKPLDLARLLELVNGAAKQGMREGE